MAELSQRKIIFLAIVAITFIGITLGILALSNQGNKTTTKGEIVVWINEGTTDDFQKIIDGFHAYNPENKNISIRAEKKSSTTISGYNSLLLQSIANGEGPDIFMLPKNEYTPLESRIVKIPQDYINIADFERRFDPIFSDLIVSEKIDNENVESILGIPLGYETLGVFYNRSLFRSGIPSNWDQIENMYGQFPSGIFPTNLGLKKNFVPNISDILPFFLGESEIFSYKDTSNIISPFQKYYNFGNLNNGTLDGEDIYSQNDTLRRTEILMKENKTTTLDEFVKGNIGMIIGYPSLISELELSQKRVGASGMEGIIYTDKIPQFSQTKPMNIGKYNFFAISKNSEKQDIALQFLQYLTTPEAGQIAMGLYPTQIPAQTVFHSAANTMPLSKNFSKTKLDAFIPSPNWSVKIFDYGSKNTFDATIDNNWGNFSSSAGLSELGTEISTAIDCEIIENKEGCSQK